MPRTIEEIFSPVGTLNSEEMITPLVVGCPAYSQTGYFPKPAITERYCGMVDDLLGVSCTLAKFHGGSHLSHEEDFWFVWQSIPQLAYPGDKTWPSTRSNKTSTPSSGGRGDRSTNASQTSGFLSDTPSVTSSP